MSGGEKHPANTKIPKYRILRIFLKNFNGFSKTIKLKYKTNGICNRILNTRSKCVNNEMYSFILPSKFNRGRALTRCAAYPAEEYATCT